MPEDHLNGINNLVTQQPSASTDESSERDAPHDLKDGDEQAKTSHTENNDTESAEENTSPSHGSISEDSASEGGTDRNLPIIISLLPSSVSIPVGQTASLTLTISPVQDTALEIPLTQDPPYLVKLFPTVTIPAGKTDQIFTIERLKEGNVSVTANLNQSSGRAIVDMPVELLSSYRPWWHFWNNRDAPAPKNSRVRNIQRASNSLLGSFFILILLFLVVYALLTLTEKQATLPVVLLFGALGSFLAQQRRLKELSDEDLELFNYSTIYKWLSPLAGATLAGILYLIFIGGLLGGELFPTFELPEKGTKLAKSGLPVIFEIGSTSPPVYAKLLFWSFIAGYSERFVTDIIGRFETQAVQPSETAQNGEKSREQA